MTAYDTRPETLWWRYAVAIALIASLVTGSHVLSHRAIEGGEETASAINIGGRQRMLSQRILQLLAREQAKLGDEARIASDLDDSVALFSRSHAALRDGGDLGLTADGARDRQPVLLQGSRERPSLDTLVKAFLRDVNVVRGTVPGDRDAALDRLFSPEVSDRLLLRLDGAVRIFEGQARDNVSLVRQISNLGFIAALLVLAFEALFIFAPTQRAVTRAVSNLRASNALLEEQQQKLSQSVRAAEMAQADVETMLKTRTDFFSNMSHELRTPLTVLRGFLDILGASELDKRQGRMVSLASNAASQMHSIVNDILDISKMEEGMLEIFEHPFDLKGLIERTTSMFQTRADEKGLTLSYIVDDSLPREVIGDEARLQQILNNLLSNAIKFTLSGGVSVHAECEQSEGGVPMWALVVSDTGTGIAEADQQRLFGRFEQSSRSMAVMREGTGLGLAICRELAELMGGRMELVSTLGEGSTFRLVIPLKQPAEEEPLRRAA